MVQAERVAEFVELGVVQRILTTAGLHVAAGGEFLQEEHAAGNDRAARNGPGTPMIEELSHLIPIDG